MSQTITIKLSPKLYSEVYGHTVETGLYDHRGGNQTVGLSLADVSLYEKLEKSSTIMVDAEEAASLYNTLFYLVDCFHEWAEEEGVQWLSVAKAARRQMEILRGHGLQFDTRGWAIMQSPQAPVPQAV